jgi:TPR repeat protein
MYEHYATPLRTDGIAKVNVCFTVDAASAPPADVLGVADVWEAFDIEHFRELTASQQQSYYLDRLHAALIRCTEQYQWESAKLKQAYDRIVRESFRFQFLWQKPLASPDRRTKVQVFVDVQRCVKLYLIFFDRDLRELHRTLFSVTLPASGIPERRLGRIVWDDNRTARVFDKNNRDYWLISDVGDVSFHYPRAEDGDAHGEFDLGIMYYEGRKVLQDRERGLKLIESAASKGYKHAVRFLECRT